MFSSIINVVNAKKMPSQSCINALGIVLGCSVICLALISFFTSMQVNDIVTWVSQHFGITFTIIFTVLLICAVLAIFHINQNHDIHYWSQVGAQAANGISTLALTFTLLGISLGIGALSEQSLTPENVNNVISILTTQFSMAFMTTVIGLPSATALRACLAILVSKKLKLTQNIEMACNDSAFTDYTNDQAEQQSIKSNSFKSRQSKGFQTKRKLVHQMP